MNDVIISGYARTPLGSFQGEFSKITAPILGGEAIKKAILEAGVNFKEIEEVIMGCVLQAGIGQAPARQASFNAGLSKYIPAVTINKMCGSGLKTVIMGSEQIKAETNNVLVTGGMESMTNAPYLSKNFRDGARIGHTKMYDHMFLDGLEDAYDEGRLMGSFAEDCARNYQFTRIQQDEYAIKSLENALNAQEMGLFTDEIAPVKVTKKNKEEILITEDQQPKRSNPEKIPTLRPAFSNDGTVTAANSSSISDGAAALVICSQKYADKKNLKTKAKIKGYTGHAHEPGWFTTAPIPAAKKLLELINWSIEEVDLWEVNEAFAVVPMAFMRELKISREKINVNGGACSLGHPIGASGARILISLINALKQRELKKGVAAICIGGGEALAIAIEVD
ncbi:MAG: thiolase family protein [Paracoccaceae bacterium]